MNVAFDPWIPVVTEKGENRLVSLCSIFTEGKQFSDLSVRPHERVSLMRLFLCVVHAALDGPKDFDEWKAVPDRLDMAAAEYLEKWRDSFELFHPTKPWLQVANISNAAETPVDFKDISKWTPVTKLCFSYATGNNTTLFDHEGMNEFRDVPINQTVLSLLSYQCFSPGGLIAQVYWNGKQSTKTSRDAPCIPASMYHAFLRGENIYDTVCLNLVSYDYILQHYKATGRPMWEMLPQTFDDINNINNATKTYIGRLIPLTRLVLLHPTQPVMLLGNGLTYSAFTDGFPAEPSATVIKREGNKKEERTVLSCRADKSIWRELAAMIVMRNAEDLGGPLWLRNIRQDTSFDLVVAALARDQANIVNAIESVISIPSHLSIDEGRFLYESEVNWAESLSGKLGWAVEVYRNKIDGGWDGRLKNAGAGKNELKYKLKSAATRFYWTAVEKNLSLLFSCIEQLGSNEFEKTEKLWHNMLFSAACDAYRTACGQETPREIKAFAAGWQKLTARKEQVEHNETDKEDDDE